MEIDARLTVLEGKFMELSGKLDTIEHSQQLLAARIVRIEELIAAVEGLAAVADSIKGTVTGIRRAVVFIIPLLSFVSVVLAIILALGKL